MRPISYLESQLSTIEHGAFEGVGFFFEISFGTFSGTEKILQDSREKALSLRSRCEIV